jgi:hypothetical protein
MPPQKEILSDKLSPELLEAQAKLLQLRANLGIAPSMGGASPLAAATPETGTNWSLRNAQAALQQRRLQLGIAKPATSQTAADWPDEVPASNPIPDVIPRSSTTVTVHPTIAMAILRQHLEAPARVYFLLRVIDVVGRGWLPLGLVREQLTKKESPLRICGWRRLRQLLKEGEGIFWHRDDQDRLWTKGAHRIAYTLDSGRLQGFPVALPTQAFLGGIQAVRAAFYGCFHGGRDSKPISRDTLRSVTGLAERTQRAYDLVAKIKRQRNIAIGEGYSQEKAQERAWLKGRAVFHFIDAKGLQGRVGREYVAWHLPNSYQTIYQRRSRGSRKRLNRKLNDLLTKGITGNTEAAVEKVFFPTGALAVRRYNRDPDIDAYWRQEQATRTETEIWRVITSSRKCPAR